MTYKLELTQVSKSYGDKKVIDDLSLGIEPGEFFVVLGPSGEGKSTLLKLIAGIEQPDSGRIFVNGVDVTGQPPNKRNIAMVFQSYALYPNMTVRGNISFPLRMHGASKDTIRGKVESVSKLLKIDSVLESPVSKISGGQQQRVALARALVRDPSVFLLDEPLSNLDARVRLSARAELKRIQRELNQTFIYVTHDQKEAASLADRVGVLHGGKFECVSRYQDMYEAPLTKWLGDFLGDFPMNFIPINSGSDDGAVEAGFRPEWVKVGSEGFHAEVEAIESSGGLYYLFCVTPEGPRVVIRDSVRREVGEEIRFKPVKQLTFRNGMLVQTPGEKLSEPSSRA